MNRNLFFKNINRLGNNIAEHPLFNFIKRTLAMMKQVHLFYVAATAVALSILFTAAYGQQLNLNHTLRIGGVGRNDIHDILYDARDKSLVFTGFVWGSCGTGDIPPCPPVSGDRDLVIGKVDSSGQLLWIRQYASTLADAGVRLMTTADGYVVLGAAGTNDGDAANHSFSNSGWLLKLDFYGALVWSRGYGSPDGVEALLGGMRTADGGYVFTGSSSGSGGDIPFQYVNSPFAYDGFVIKTDSLGNVQWSRTLGGTGNDYFINVFEINKEYYIAASSTSHDHECNDNSWHPGKNTTLDYYLIKLDSAGNYLWNRSYGGSNADYLWDAIFDERDSTIMMIGYTQSRDYMVQPPGPVGRLDTWVVKAELDGSLKWARIYGDSALNEGPYCHIRPIPGQQGYAITYTAQTSYPPPAPAPPPPYYGQEDLHISLIDSSGNLLADKIIGGTGRDYEGVCIAIPAGFVVAGYTDSQQFAEGTSSPTFGGIDAFISYLEYHPAKVPGTAGVKQALQLYPNPADQNVTVILPENAAKGVLTITDAWGKEVRRQQVASHTAQVTLSTAQWTSGIYMVSWVAGRDQATARLIIK